MSRKKSKTLEIFSLSFLDCICCGFGAVILIFVLTTGRGLKVDERKISVASETVKQLESEIVTQREVLAESQSELSSLEAMLKANMEANQAAAALNQQIEEKLSELEKLKRILSQQSDAINKQASLPKPQVPTPSGSQNLGGFDIHGERIVILLEASGGMFADNVTDALKQLKLPQSKRLQSPKWQRAVLAVKTLLLHLPTNARVQIYAYNSAPLYIGPATPQWLNPKSRKAQAQIDQALSRLIPAGGANLEKAFKRVRALQADTILLITDGLPTQSDSVLTKHAATQSDRIRMLENAIKIIPGHTSISTIILPMAGDPAAVPYYWRVAIDTNGSLISPAASWP